MATGRRLVYQYAHEGVHYGPYSDPKDVPDHIKERDKEISNKKFREKHNKRRRGGRSRTNYGMNVAVAKEERKSVSVQISAGSDTVAPTHVDLPLSDEEIAALEAAETEVSEITEE